MVIDKFIHILKNSDEITNHNALDFKNILEEYPYFQPARSLYIKALKNQESFKYNFELKKTAAYTTDRNVLFNFITAKKIKKTLPVINETPKSEEVTKPVTDNKTDKNTTSSSALPEKTDVVEENTIEEVKEKLEIGKPIGFSVNEGHSFNQWMQLTSKKTITRKPTEVNKPQEIKKVTQKTEKEIIVDNFIIKKPKITPLEKTTASNSSFKPIDLQKTRSNEVMTETLAKVYLEQKKYDSAKKAYEILSLKYPEKSGFFADQIKRIQIIQKK